jgi:long-chain acyl-CoA synthetase
MASSAATIAQMFDRQAKRYGDRACLKAKEGKQWRDHSWREVAQSADRLRAGLIGIGLRPGERLAILADNGPNWIVVDQAALGMGAVVVPLYTTNGPEEMQHILNDSGAAVAAIQGSQNLRKISALKDRLPRLRTLLRMDRDGAGTDGSSANIPSIAELGSGESAGVLEGRGEDLATLIYTSGTTGPSKGVMLTHRNILSNAEASMAHIDLSEGDMTLSFLPIAHAFERTVHYTVFMAGGTVAYAEGLTQIAQNLLEVNPTILLTVPRLLEVIHGRILRTIEGSSPLRQRIFRFAIATGTQAAWYRHRGRPLPAHLAAAMALLRKLVFARIRALFGSRIRYLISGGAPLPLEVFELLAAAEVPIVEGYGLTEASPVVSCNLHGRTRPGTVGPPLKNVTVRTAADGELLIRADSVMAGYFNRELETREAVDAQGFLHTGDVAEIDADGFIKIKDRKKEIIVLSGGKNVSPANLETRLMADPYIAQACVFGDRRKHLAALLVPNFATLRDQARTNQLPADAAPEALVVDPQVRAFYQRKIRDFNKAFSDVEAIAAFTLIASSFSQENGELTPTMKVRRRVIANHYQQQIEAMYRN